MRKHDRKHEPLFLITFHYRRRRELFTLPSRCFIMMSPRGIIFQPPPFFAALYEPQYAARPPAEMSPRRRWLPFRLISLSFSPYDFIIIDADGCRIPLIGAE